MFVILRALTSKVRGSVGDLSGRPEKEEIPKVSARRSEQSDPKGPPPLHDNLSGAFSKSILHNVLTSDMLNLFYCPLRVNLKIFCEINPGFTLLLGDTVFPKSRSRLNFGEN